MCGQTQRLQQQVSTASGAEELQTCAYVCKRHAHKPKWRWTVNVRGMKSDSSRLIHRHRRINLVAWASMPSCYDGAGCYLRLPIARHNCPTRKRPDWLVPKGSGRSRSLFTLSTLTTARSAGSSSTDTQGARRLGMNWSRYEFH